MSTLRQIKRQARRDLHDQMCVPALYIVPSTNAVIPCRVRVHSEWGALGGVGGTSFAYAEREERGVELVFWRSEIPLPQRKAIISVEPGEAYRVDAANAPDDQTITARVVPLKPLQASAYPVPATYNTDAVTSFDPELFDPENSTSTYFQARLVGLDRDLITNEKYAVPLNQLTSTVNERKGLYLTHDFFQNDRLAPFAIGDQYYLRLDVELESLAPNNTIVACLDTSLDGSSELQLNQTLTEFDDVETQTVSLFTKVFVDQEFIDNGMGISFAFTQDTRLISLRVYVST